jgi:hypothetical protein
MTSPVPVKRAKRSRTLASATPVSSAISESSRWPYFCRHCRMSIKVSLPLLDAIVAMNPGDENLHLASAARRRHGRWCHMSSLRAPSDTSASRSTTRWRSPSKLRCSPARLVATAEPDGRRPAKSSRLVSPLKLPGSGHSGPSQSESAWQNVHRKICVRGNGLQCRSRSGAMPSSFDWSDSEAVREWLDSLRKDQRKAIGEDVAAYVQFRWPIGKPHVDSSAVTAGDLRDIVMSGEAGSNHG